VAEAERHRADLEEQVREARAARERLRQEWDTAQREATALRGALAEARAQLEALRDAPPPAPPPDELATETDWVWRENERLEEELRGARGRVEELEAELRNCKENLALLGSAHTPAPAPPPAPHPAETRRFGRVADALRAAAEEFADVLTVWERATQSAEESSFASPAKVFRALEAIAQVGRDYFARQGGGPGMGPLDQAFKERVPFKYSAFESQTTLSLYGSARVFRHGTQSRQMQRHLTLGGGATNNCLQIYFEFDEASRRVLIGYCGRHLPYYGQRT
jgi:hypothetical protein